MSKPVRRCLIVFAVSFTALFLIRFAYGFVRYPFQEPAHGYVGDNSFISFSVRNIATAKTKLQSAGAPAQTVDQKYEKISTMNARTDRFDQDEEALREAVKKYQALIQFEQNQGLPGHRTLYMALGVHPESFDVMTAAVRRIGDITSISVNKTDKTNEYKELLAKKASLEKTRDALKALKSRTGRIEEFVALENRILDVEEEIQSLGLSLGVFDAENEFCTIQYTLTEQAPRNGIPFLQRIIVALEWTIKYYLLTAAGLLAVSLAVLVGMAVLEKLKGWVLPGQTSG